MELIFQGIRNFIENSSITQRSRGTTFHETMTYFWVHMVHFAMEAAKFKRSTDEIVVSDPDFKEFLLRNPQLANGGLFLHYYSKELMLKTADSRLQVMLPDKRPLPSILSDVQANDTYVSVQLSGPMADSKFLALVLQSKAPAVGHEARIRTIWTCIEVTNNLRESREKAFVALQILDGEGYHETCSYFWIQMVTLARAKTDDRAYATYHDFVRDAKAQFLRNPDYSDKFYSTKMWVQGVTAMVLPDKKQLPNAL